MLIDRGRQVAFKLVTLVQNVTLKQLKLQNNKSNKTYFQITIAFIVQHYEYFEKFSEIIFHYFGNFIITEIRKFRKYGNSEISL